MTFLLAAVVLQLGDLATYAVASTMPYGHEVAASANTTPDRAVIAKALGIVACVGIYAVVRYRAKQDAEAGQPFRWPLAAIGASIFGAIGLVGLVANVMNGIRL